MNKEEWLKSLEDKLNLPNEYSREIIAEFESHLFQSQYDSSFNLNKLGKINLLIDQIMKSKHISTLDLLKLRSTWSLVALIIALLVIPYFVVFTLYIHVIGLIYSIFYQTMSPIFGSIWLGGFWLCIVLLLIVLSYALTKVLQKWKSENQRLLSLSLSFFLIVVYFLNRIYFWDYSEKALIYQAVSIGILLLLTALYYKITSVFVSKFKKILGTGLVYVFVILLAFIVFLPVMLINDKIVSSVATIWYSDTVNAGKTLSKEIDLQLGLSTFDLDTFNSPEIEKFGKITHWSATECWGIEGTENAEGCNYKSKTKILDPLNCKEYEDLSTCKSFSVWEDAVRSRDYRILINDKFECFSVGFDDDYEFQCFYKVH